MSIPHLHIVTLTVVLDLAFAGFGAAQGDALRTVSRLSPAGPRLVAFLGSEVRNPPSGREARLIADLPHAAPILRGFVTDAGNRVPSTSDWAPAPFLVPSRPASLPIFDGPIGRAGTVPSDWSRAPEDPDEDEDALDFRLPGLASLMATPDSDGASLAGPRASVIDPLLTIDLRPLLQIGLLPREAGLRARCIDSADAAPDTRPTFAW
jgi:hypothetical protein